MIRHRMLWLFIGLLFLSSLACNAFAEETEPALTLPPPPTSAVSDLPTVPLGTIAPTATLPGVTPGVATSTPESSEPRLQVLVDLNVRRGPGVQYDRVSFMLSGETALVLGVDPNSGWWKIQCPPRSTELTECWVSGGPQYTSASNVQDIPVAAAPPTPTPPPTAVPAGGVLAYADASGLWVARLDLDNNPPTADPAVQLVAASDVQDILIAPDGQKIAYVTGDFTTNALYVINKDGSQNQLLVDSSTLPADITDPASFAVLLGQIEWLADSESLIFNTNLVGLEGPGFGPQADLWTVTLAGNLTERFAAGAAGGQFAINGNQLLLSKGNRILRANLDGSNVETMVTFDSVNTAAGYSYFPDVAWYNGTGLATVSSPNPIFETATADLWQIPASGAALRLGTIPGLILMNSPRWSPDGSRLAYVKSIPDTPPATLTLTDGQGQNPFPYSTRNGLMLFDWSSDNRHFLFAATDFFAVGQVGDPAVPIGVFPGTAVSDAQWVLGDTFLYATGQSPTWTLLSGNIEGNTSTLLEIQRDGPALFAVQGQ